jgi:hypothetical protein
MSVVIKSSIQTVVREAIKNAEKKVVVPQIFKIQTHQQPIVKPVERKK